MLLHQSALPNTASLAARLQSPTCQQTRRKTQVEPCVSALSGKPYPNNSASNLQSMFHQSGCHAAIVSESVRKTREAEDEQSAPDPLPVETHLLRNGAFDKRRLGVLYNLMKDINTDSNKHVIKKSRIRPSDVNCVSVSVCVWASTVGSFSNSSRL